MTTLPTDNKEYSAIEIRNFIQRLFPNRKLVLSQFTFFGHLGVSKATGNTFRRGRRCYRLLDILSIACVISLKEQGISLKNIEAVPALIQSNVEDIFSKNSGCKLSGYKDVISLVIPDSLTQNMALELFLDNNLDKQAIFWSFDLSALVCNIKALVQEETADVQVAA
jgi:DNA-binding transcriptional MerR regulator